jgi:FkbM family methyltransferase
MTPKVVREPSWTFKLLPEALKELGLDKDLEGVIHVGAHWGQEVHTYLSLGLDPIILVEPDPVSVVHMHREEWFYEKQIHVIEAAITPREGMVDFYNLGVGNGVWNGLRLNPQRSENAAIIPVQGIRIDTIQATWMADMLVVDTQGTELEALGTANLQPLELIIIETQVNGVDGAHPQELEQWCQDHEWEQAIVWDRTGGWTDVLMVPRR